MKIIIGLGNPGKKYENTRHNVGFTMIDHLRKQLNGSEWEDSKFHALLSEGICHYEDGKDEAIHAQKSGLPRRIAPRNDETLVFMKPMTFMNLSGDAVASIVHFYKLDPTRDILVISDDLDMEFGKVRYRDKGSHGGQNGLRDISTKLGTNEFSRIKIGIGRHPQFEVVDWVLSKFSKEEIEFLESTVHEKVGQYTHTWLGD